MSEGEQTPAAQPEAKYGNPVVEAARGAVRKSLEAYQAKQDWINSLTVKESGVYRAWADAVDNYHASMTDVDRRRLSTKLESVKMRLKGLVSSVTAPVADALIYVVGRPMKLAGVGVMAVGGVSAFTPFAPASLELVSAGAAMFIGGKLIDKKAHAEKTSLKPIFGRKFVSHENVYAKKSSKQSAEDWSAQKIAEYKVKLENAKKMKGFSVKEKAMGMLTNFAYPEGKPPLPVAK